MPGREESVKVADGSTWREDGVAAVPAYELAHLLQHDVFHQNEHRSDLIGEHIRVRRCGQPLASHGH